MSLEDGQKIYTLKKPLSYKLKGETKQAQFIELKEPKMSHSRGYNKISQMVSGLTTSSALKMKALGIEEEEVTSGTEVKKLHEVDQDEYESEAEKFGEMLGSLFGFSDDENLQANFVDTFRDMACKKANSSICIIDGEEPMAIPIWEDMSPEDGLGLALAWASFFTMPPELEKPKESDSVSG